MNLKSAAKVGIIAISLIPFLAGTSPAADDWYMGLNAGPQWRAKASDSAGTTDFDAGWAVNVSVGREIGSFRVEGEGSYLVNTLGSTDPAGPAIGKEDSFGNVDIHAVVLNLFYDLKDLSAPVVPYFGVGAGGHKVSINGLTTESLRTLPAEYGGPVVVYAESNWAFAYQLTAGFSYGLTDKADLSLGYRYLAGDDLDINLGDGSTIHPDVEVHAVRLGVHIAL